jgi:hypothetical protein
MLMQPCTSLTQNSSNSRKSLTTLSVEALAEVPVGATNLEIYLRRDQSFERISMGLRTLSSSVGNELKDWEQRWKALSQKND